MKQFYSKTYFFWVITRVAVIVLGAIDVCSLMSRFGISLLYLLQSGYLIANFAIVYKELMRKPPEMGLKYIVGALSIFIGLALSYWQFNEPKANWGPAKYEFDYLRLLVYIISGWLIVFGLFDFFKIERTPEE